MQALFCVPFPPIFPHPPQAPQPVRPAPLDPTPPLPVRRGAYREGRKRERDQMTEGGRGEGESWSERETAGLTVLGKWLVLLRLVCDALFLCREG